MLGISASSMRKVVVVPPVITCSLLPLKTSAYGAGTQQPAAMWEQGGSRRGGGKKGRHGKACYWHAMGMAWYGMVCVWHGMLWCSVVWYACGMAWHGMVWYGMGME